MMKKLVGGLCNPELSGPLRRVWLVAMFTVVLVSTTQAQTIESVIPEDSLVYLKLQNLEACREAIESPQSWKEAAGIISASPKWQTMSQFMQMLPMFVGTDVHGLIDTFLGGQIAVTVSPGAEGLMVGIVIENEGKIQAAEQILSKLIGALGSTEGTPVQPKEGEYGDMPYHTAQVNTMHFTYGRVNETLLLVGITPGSFEKMIDTYKTEGSAITENPDYDAVVDTFGKSEVFAFVNVETAGPFLKVILTPPIRTQLDAFQTLVYRWELLRPGGSQQLYGKLKNNTQGALISLFQEPSTMQAIQGLSGEEELFLTVAPSSAHTLWQLILGPKGDTTSAADGSLGSFLIPAQTDILGAVTDGLVISADLSTLNALAQQGPNFITNSNDGVIESVEIDFPEADFGVIFNPTSPVKWQGIFKSLLEKLTTAPPQQFEYRSITFTSAFIPGPLYYGSVNELFVLALSEKQWQSIVDNILATRKPLRHLEGLPANPACLFQLNLDRFLSIIVSAAETAWLGPEAIAFTEQIGSLFASLAVGAGEAWVDLTLCPEEKPMNAVARVAPIIFFAVTRDGNGEE